MHLKTEIERALPGTKESKLPHMERADRIMALIRERFGIRHDLQLRCKHLQWLLSRKLAHLRPSTRNDYWGTVVVICWVLGKEHWLPHLKGPWTSRDGIIRENAHPGGRPRKLPSRAKVP